MIHISGVEDTFRYLDNLDNSISKKAVIAITEDVFDNVKESAKKHYDTGVMESNIRKKVKGSAGIVWIDDKNMLVDWKGKKVNYATFVLFGSKPHEITAKNKRALRWGGGGLWHFAKSVQHPGYRGDNFLITGAKKTFDNLEKLYKDIK